MGLGEPGERMGRRGKTETKMRLSFLRSLCIFSFSLFLLMDFDNVTFLFASSGITNIMFP